MKKKSGIILSALPLLTLGLCFISNSSFANGVNGNEVILVNSMGAQQKTGEIRGVVLDGKTSEPVIGAAVKVKGTTVGTVTDIDGRFELPNIPSSAKTLVISYIGMKTQELAIKSPLKVVLEPDAQTLDDVIVVAYGTQKKSSFTGAASTVGAQTLEKRVISNATAALEGNASGVQVTAAGGQPGESAAVRIRGFGSVNASNAPLYVVDGTVYNGSISVKPLGRKSAR